MGGSFRGVVRAGLFVRPDEVALVVSHPHPDSHYGGGPGPVADWRKPYDSDVYRENVDVDDYGEDFSLDDVTLEIHSYSHVAFGEGEAWELCELEPTGTIDDLRAIDDDTTAALVTYGGAVYYVWHRSRATKATRTYELRGLPNGIVQPTGALVGRDLVVAGSKSFDQNDPSVVGLLEIRDDSMTWARALGQTPGRVVAIDAERAPDGTLVVYAGGKALWQLVDGEWRDVSMSSDITFVHCEPSGEVIAGTSRGDVIAGVGTACRTIARVGPIHTAARFGDAIYFADDDRVYRVVDGASGFEKCFRPDISSDGDWPSTGRLAVGRGRLWLAGSHAVVFTENGQDWSTLA